MSQQQQQQQHDVTNNDDSDADMDILCPPPPCPTVASRSNTELTEAERGRKQRLKRWLRFQIKERKMLHRVMKVKERQIKGEKEQQQHNVERLLKIARADLVKAQAAVEGAAAEFEGTATNCHTARSIATDPRANEIQERAHACIVSTYHDLQRALPSDEDVPADATVTKHEYRHEQARELLYNMTRATQQLNMFQNTAALRGYVRQKFIERANLMTTTLSKLVPTEHGYVNGPCEVLWERLQCVDFVVSIGCGPGCDALGLAAWCRAIQQEQKQPQQQQQPQRSKSSIRRAVLLDWAMNEWRDPILSTLHDLLVPEFYNRVDCAVCNVTVPWDDVINKTGRDFVVEENNKYNNKNNVEGSTTTLYVTSYLLSETRGQWETFYQQLWDEATPGSLWLFTDPTAWQLREWLSRRPHTVVYTWLDSCMHHPALQVLENRVNAAALLAMKPME